MIFAPVGVTTLDEEVSAVYPGIRYAGRLTSDPPGELSQGEATLIDGSGSQLGPSNRRGDYTSLNVDPADDRAFWYVNEYYAVSSSRGWQTRIGAGPVAVRFAPWVRMSGWPA